MRQRCCGDKYRLAVDAGLGWDEVVILSCDFECVYGLAIGGESAGVVEPDADCGAAVRLQLEGRLAEERRGVRQVFVIDHVAGGEGETVADGLLVGRMDVVG